MLISKETLEMQQIFNFKTVSYIKLRIYSNQSYSFTFEKHNNRTQFFSYSQNKVPLVFSYSY